MAGLPVLAARRTSFGALLQELQQLWNEIGESAEEKDRMNLELEKECMRVYQRKIDEARSFRARLSQSLLTKEAEISSLMALLGEQVLHLKVEETTSFKGKLASVNHLLDYLRGKKEDRVKQFSHVCSLIEELNEEITGLRHQSGATEEHDLSLRKFAEYQIKLRSLQMEKSDRLRKVSEHLNEVRSLCGVLGMDFRKIADEMHPNLHEQQLTSISDSTLEGLSRAILNLKTEKKLRFQKLQDIAVSLFELWNMLGSPKEEMKQFEKVKTALRSQIDDVVSMGMLSLESMEQAEAEVERLKKLKLCRMKELFLQKRSELEEVCRNTHIEPEMSTAPQNACALLDSCLVDHSELLANLEAQIVKAKEQSMMRKEIIDRVNKWLSACEEENWLEDYDMDENKYTAGRGAHLNLKRAEKARVTISRIPAIVDNLINKISIWEDENSMPFLYDGVPLVSILEDYKLERLQKEELKQRYREQKRLQNLLLTEKQAMYGSKRTPRRSNSFGRKTSAHLANIIAEHGSGSPSTSAAQPQPEPLSQRSSSARYGGYYKEARRLSSAAQLFSSEFGSPPL